MNPSALTKDGRLVYMNCVRTKAFNSQSLSLSSHQWAKAETWSPWTPTACLIPTSSSSSSRTPKTRPRRRPKPSAPTSTPNGTRPLICELKKKKNRVLCSLFSSILPHRRRMIGANRTSAAQKTLLYQLYILLLHHPPTCLALFLVFIFTGCELVRPKHCQWFKIETWLTNVQLWFCCPKK